MRMAGTDEIRAIVEGVRGKDYSVQLVARKSGGQAVPALVPLLRDPDSDVRQLAVHCLAETGDPSAADGLIEALLDPDSQVAMAAAKALHRLARVQQVDRLVDARERITDPTLRREVALILGRIGQPALVQTLRAHAGRDAAPEAAEGILVALAKLGEGEARRVFRERLLSSRGLERKAWLDYCEYIDQPWLLEPLSKVLDDPTPVLRVGVDARPDLIESLRSCDLALNLIAHLANARFSFLVNRAKNYSPAELDEARRFVGSLP